MKEKLTVQMRVTNGGQHIVSSRLLILQSKRLMLNSCQRRMEDRKSDDMIRRADRLRREIEMAQHLYRKAILGFGSVEDTGYWVVAYNRLVEMGTMLSNRLRDAVGDLPVGDRYQVSADVESLELIVDEWRDAMRRSMSAASAVTG